MYAYKTKVKGSANWNIGIHAEDWLGECVYVGDVYVSPPTHESFVEITRRVAKIQPS